MAAATGQATIFVDHSAGGSNNGMSWVDAYTSLDGALATAVSGDAILVAHGTYRPGVARDASDPRSRTFQLIGGLRIVGGFVGGGGSSTDPDTPDGSARLTLLRGDNATPATSDDMYNVVVAPATAAQGLQEIENLTISDGRADGTTPFVEYQRNGGAIYSSAPASTGGCMLRLETCILSNNYAEESGGAVFYEGATAGSEFFGAVQCFVNGNEAGERGGGFALGTLGAETTATDDGSYVMNCTFFENAAGGAAATLTDAGGGAVWIGGLDSVATFQMSNNRALNNEVRGRGAAYAFAESGRFSVANDTIAGNVVTETSGEAPCAVFFSSSFVPSVAFFRNNIVWGNAGSVLPTLPSFEINLLEDGGVGSVTVAYNDIEIGGPIAIPPTPPPVYTGTGNINASPGFVAPASLDYSLSAGSPCIDAGLNAAVNWDLGNLDDDTLTVTERVPLDFRRASAFPREVGTVDMGAYEQ